ncbi:MAG: tRNA pseudouridine(55) synthase TruB [Gallionellaceae bacterium]|nr:tRNA pseudouridine(55) synthase TruB [Gallionellaceae bacterium]
MVHSWRPLDGVLLFDKPLELSSNIALQKVRRLYQAEKAGHTGTLDPLASGLLPICFGEATKFSLGLLDADKTYRATICLGETTTTGDAEGEVLKTRPVEVTEAIVQQTLKRFCGASQQLPPMYSALKHEGKPLYEYIRKGVTIERALRDVFIHELRMERLDGNELEIVVRCSKGTYVRTLGEDIGEVLGCGGHLTALRRTAIARFDLKDAYTLDQLASMDDQQRLNCLLPLDCMLQDMPSLELSEIELHRMAQGQRLGKQLDYEDGKIRLYSNGKFVGVAELLGTRLAPSRLLASVAKSAASVSNSGALN